MKKVLVAVDIARTSGNDVEMKTAQTVAGAMDGTLAILHVIQPLPHYVIPQIPEWVLGKRKSHAEEELLRLGAKYGCSDTVVREGTPSTEILKHASDIEADLIVLHSHDPDLSNYILGSTASRVVRHAHCSVYVVRHPEGRSDGK